MNFFEENEKMYFSQKPERAIFHHGNFDSTKSSLHHVAYISSFIISKLKIDTEPILPHKVRQA